MKIEFIYSNGLKTVADKAVKRALSYDNSQATVNEDGYVVVEVGKNIPCDSTVVFLTEDIESDAKWNAHVGALPDDKKIILVSRVVTEGVRLSDLIPEKIRKINTIKLDDDNYDYKLDELWDVLCSDKDYYTVISALYSMVEGWIVSGRTEVKLLHNIPLVIRYKRYLKKTSANEKRPYFRQRLEEINEYLKVSLSEEIVHLLKRSVHSLPVIALLLFVSVFIIAQIYGVPKYMRITRNAAAICGDEFTTLHSPVQVLKTVEVIRNPMINASLKEEAFQKYNSLMCDNWPNTVIGGEYKYAQNDVRVCSDDRYIYTASGNGCCLKWDTYTGKIVKKDNISKNPLYVIDVINDEQNIIAVDEAGSVFYLSDGQWISSEGIIAEYGYSTGVSLAEDRACILTNYNSVIMLDIRDGRISVVNAFSFDDVYGIKQNPDHALLVVSDNGKDKMIKVGSDGEITDSVILEYELDKTCNVDFKEDKVLFVSSSGNVYILDAGDGSFDMLPTIITQPVRINFINDTAFYYCDRNKGNCLYDYAHGIDLGSFLPEAGFVSYSACGGNTVVCFSSGFIFSENIGDLLPLENIDSSSVLQTFEDTEGKSGGYIRQAQITDEKYIFADITGDSGQTFSYFVDGGHYYLYTAPDQRAASARADGFEYVFSQPSAVVFTGAPTVVGVLENGDTMVIGASDGTFCEMVCTGDNIVNVTGFKVPSGSPVRRIYLTDNDCFYIEDSDGLFWKARYGSAAVSSYEGMFNEIRNKLHYGMYDDIRDSVTDYVLKSVGVEYVPGHDGKMWE